ncbi:MAG: hypothetical protein HKN72_00955 [Gemmatimonadetes bacterium]|nr:hypothetical protein [Gemmatimonadota bacterium]NNF11761.1 hypothetical protein [Gemmatimonadota bacterium]
MKTPLRDAGLPGATADMGSGAEYRIREVEARLDRRLTAVEGRNGQAGWAVRLVILGLVATVAALGVALWRVVPDDGAWAVSSLSAEELVLRDAEGVARGRMATDTEGRAQLTLSDQDGRERIRLTVLADGSPGVTIHDREARPRAVLGYLSDGTTNLVFADELGVSRAVVGIDPDGSSQAFFTDVSGSIRTLVGVGPDGEPSVSTYERAGGS